MKKLAIFWERRFENNRFYDLSIDKNLSPFYKLAKINGFENTISLDLLSDRSDKDDFVILCFLTISTFTIHRYLWLFAKYPKNKKYLFLFEPSVVAPFNYLKIFHLPFDRIYTWNDELVDNKKYYKFIYPQSYHSIMKYNDFNKRKLVTLINGNKFSFIKNELYSEREKVIRFFEENYPLEFDLYGTNWDKPNLKQKIFGFKKYVSYKGKVKDKIKTLSNYKFNICFENMRDIPGYITEKIWDSFKAKAIPIYWGASNIEDYIPKNCFIDFRMFDGDYKKMYEYIKSMDEKTFRNYIKNIEDFLNTEKAKSWFEEKWAINFLNSL